MVHAMQLNPAMQLAKTFDEASARLMLWVMEHKALVAVLLVATLLLLVAMGAEAGTTATEFKGVYDKIKEWTSGYLGKAIALFAFLLGLGVGVAKASPIPAISGIVFALFVAFGPAVLEGIATATI